MTNAARGGFFAFRRNLLDRKGDPYHPLAEANRRNGHKKGAAGPP